MATLNWIGKDKVINHHLDVPFRTLKHKYTYKNGKKSTDGTTSQNKIIHGDNLEALKSLLPEYEGRIKCVYIDPPYNTGNEGWVYNDNVNHPKIKKWLGQIVGKEGEDLSRHDKWLCMMYPRLKILSKLLRKDGVIFVSIDDNEFASMSFLLKEIFGDSTNKHLATFIWKSSGNFDNQAKVKINHEYILAYSKNVSSLPLPPVIDPNIDESSKLFRPTIRNTIVKNGPKNPASWIELPAGFPSSIDTGSIKMRDDIWPHYSSDVTIASNKTVGSVQAYSGWSSKNLLFKFINNRLEPIKDTKGQVTKFEISKTGAIEVVKTRAEDQSYVLSVLENMGNVQSTSSDLSQKGIKFDYPKPPNLVEYLISLFTANDDIILDSFAGTGTTAIATLALNRKENTDRSFILIELEDYAENITSKRVITEIKNHKKNISFEFLLLGEPLFDKEGYINEDQSIENIRKYVYHSETRTNVGYSENPKNDYYLGKRSGTAYYFYYRKKSITSLDLNFASQICIKADQYIAYADKCALSEQYMKKNKIIFKKIPRDITRV
jgi:adenine-specific DNA-methyltransferase